MVMSNGAVASVLVSFYCYDKYRDQRHKEKKSLFVLCSQIIFSHLGKSGQELKQIHEGILLAGP